MFKSKHSGWLSDGTRTPLGGKFLSSLDPGKSIGRTFAKVDPGPSIGKGLAEVDKFVNREIPGGWITVGALAAGGAALAYAPEVMAYAAETGIAPEIASAELGLPAVDASTGAFINPATGLAWEATGSGLAGNGVQLTAAEFASQAGVGELTAKEILSNASRAKQLAQMISGGSAAKPSAQQFAQFQQANQLVTQQQKLTQALLLAKV